MVLNSVCKDNSNKLSDSCENQIRMKRFLMEVWKEDVIVYGIIGQNNMNSNVV